MTLNVPPSLRCGNNRVLRDLATSCCDGGRPSVTPVVLEAQDPRIAPANRFTAPVADGGLAGRHLSGEEFAIALRPSDPPTKKPLSSPCLTALHRAASRSEQEQDEHMKEACGEKTEASVVVPWVGSH
ncbi:unnamed protein product [Arctogadus glacialis]